MSSLIDLPLLLGFGNFPIVGIAEPRTDIIIDAADNEIVDANGENLITYKVS